MKKEYSKDNPHKDIGKSKYRVRQHYVTWVEYDVVADSPEEAQEAVLEQGGIDKVTQYFKNNKIYIHKSCENLSRELVNYQWEQPSASRMDLNQPEKPLKKDDHAVDSLRYLVNEVVASQKKKDTRTDTQQFIDKIIVDVDHSQPQWDNL